MNTDKSLPKIYGVTDKFSFRQKDKDNNFSLCDLIMITDV